MPRRLPPLPGLLLPLWLGAACAGPSEAPRVAREVRASAAGLSPVTTDQGFEIQLTEARVALSDLSLTIAGELHEASLLDRVGALWTGRALAHPGHYEGGDATGELRGRFVVDWLAETRLGEATLLAGDYEGANFTFDRAGSEDGVEADDPLHGHTARLAGVARRDGGRVDFEATLDSPEGRVLVGIPFEASIAADSSGTLALRLELEDPFEGDTLFDGLDFEALDDDGDGRVVLAPGAQGEAEQAYNQLRRALQSHDHFSVRALD